MNSPLSSAAWPSSATQGECTHPKVAVVLATLGLRAALTRRTLEALTRQGCSKCEIIVVVNGESSREFESMLAQFPAKLIKVPWRGQSRAQNLGIHESEGEIVAFTDDDVVPHDDWLHQLAAGFSAPEIGCVTGRSELVDAGYLRRGLVYSQRSMSRWTLSPQDPEWVDVALQSDAGMAANHAFRRAALFRIGLISEDLSGGAAVDTIESEMYLKVLHAGYSLHHNPDAIVDLYFDDPPEVQRERLRGMRAAMVGLYLKLLTEDRGLRGIRWRIFQGLLAAIKRVLRRRSEPAMTGQVRLSGVQALGAYLFGFVLYWRSRADTARARERALGERRAEPA
jgi:cellulose synthase/poly-beta-1,6-N-acetylglucosamine synthase-like glycosyltransferase